MATKSMADFARQVRQMGSKQEQEAFYEACCKELAARLLRKVIKRTPVGEGTFEVVRDNAGAVQKHKRGKHKGKVRGHHLAALPIIWRRIRISKG